MNCDKVNKCVYILGIVLPIEICSTLLKSFSASDCYSFLIITFTNYLDILWLSSCHSCKLIWQQVKKEINLLLLVYSSMHRQTNHTSSNYIHVMIRLNFSILLLYSCAMIVITYHTEWEYLQHIVSKYDNILGLLWRTWAITSPGIIKCTV